MHIELDEAFDFPTPIFPTIRVRRLKTPPWAKFGSDAHHDHDAYRRTGEQAEWGWGIPWTYRALASPSTGEPMPAAPTPGRRTSCRDRLLGGALALVLVLAWLEQTGPGPGLDPAKRSLR